MFKIITWDYLWLWDYETRHTSTKLNMKLGFLGAYAMIIELNANNEYNTKNIDFNLKI